MIYNNNRIALYFGDASDAFYVPNLEPLRTQKQLLSSEPWCTITQRVEGISAFFFAHQVHGDMGHVVTDKLLQENDSWSLDGDYLITNELNVGIGVLTADCLPLVIYDPVHHAAGVVHAGWRGAVAGIAVKATRHLCKQYGAKIEELMVFLGPCAGSCCYQVGKDLMEALPTSGHECIDCRADGHYFDLARFVEQQLLLAGIKKEAIDLQSHRCTICDDAYFSYRRQKELAGRQITLVCLR